MGLHLCVSLKTRKILDRCYPITMLALHSTIMKVRASLAVLQPRKDLLRSGPNMSNPSLIVMLTTLESPKKSSILQLTFSNKAFWVRYR